MMQISHVFVFSFVSAVGSELKLKKVVKSFPLQDLLDGHVYYVQSDHKNKEAIQDSFLFHATDGVNNSPPQTFNISIIVRLSCSSVRQIIEWWKFSPNKDTMHTKDSFVFI